VPIVLQSLLYLVVPVAHVPRILCNIWYVLQYHGRRSLRYDEMPQYEVVEMIQLPYADLRSGDVVEQKLINGSKAFNDNMYSSRAAACAIISAVVQRPLMA
jgi:hypothetical protein